MQAIRCKNTKAELLLSKTLWSNGYRYRKNDKKVLGKPDLTFKRMKIAIFVDSEFFHGRNWQVAKFKITSNEDFWWNKIEKNIARDSYVSEELYRTGWTVLRFWDTEVKKDLSKCLTIFQDVYNQKITSGSSAL